MICLIKCLAVFSFLVFFEMNAQQQVGAYEPRQGRIKLGYGEDAIVPLSEQGYQLMLPQTVPQGVIVSLDDERLTDDDSSYRSLYKLCVQNGIAVLHVFTGIPVDLYMNESSLMITDSLLTLAFKKYDLPVYRVIFLGVMTTGHRALRYIEWSRSDVKTTFRPHIRAVILCESALDWVRQWYEGQKQVRDSLSVNGYFEGQMVSYLFAENLRATPLTDIRQVLDFSAYSYFDVQQKKPKFFSDIPVRAYTYADLKYWFSASGKGVLDSNYPDMSGFINEQKLAGNKRAELSVIYEACEKMGKEVSKNHRAQTDTWSLIDKTDLMDWLLQCLSW